VGEHHLYNTYWKSERLFLVYPRWVFPPSILLYHIFPGGVNFDIMAREVITHHNRIHNTNDTREENHIHAL
jgi:hypothetical protein